MSEIKRVSDTQFYDTGGNNPVQMEIIIGHAQVGGAYVVLLDTDNNRIPITPVGDTYTIGQPGGLKFDVVKCTVTVEDINPDPQNMTSVTFKLSGGVASRSYPYSVKVDNQNDKAVYFIDFILR